MTESDWLSAKDPDAMLRLVGPRLSVRRWHLLACGVARRAWDLLPDGPLRDAVEWAEWHAGEREPVPDRFADLGAVARVAADAARAAEREVVRPADPDADPDTFRDTDAGKSYPTAPYFRTACRNAGAAVRLAGEAVEQAAGGVAAVACLRPGPVLVAQIREVVTEATRVRAVANLHRSTALRLKAFGDEAADRETGRNARGPQADAKTIVSRELTFFGYQDDDIRAAKEAADRKALGRLLHDLVGNPFRPARFDPVWRTSTVVGLARAIDADRAFDRMPILADALLEADCNDEAILRHCRGTEAHAADVLHTRGCWVVDLILDREADFFATPLPVRRPALRSRRVYNSSRRTETADRREA